MSSSLSIAAIKSAAAEYLAASQVVRQSAIGTT